MGFKENVKAELAYKNMLIKELAARAGISRRTLDNYLRKNPSMPSVEAAARIAAALGVTVEYLVSGREEAARPPPPDSRAVLTVLESLGRRDLAIVLSMVKFLKRMEETERKVLRGTVRGYRRN